MILTTEFLVAAGACATGSTLAASDGYLGMEYGDVIKALLRDGKKEEAGWMVEQKTTELYIRMNGEIVMNETYQVFDPITGQHKQFETENEAIAELARISNEVLRAYGAAVLKELRNDKGDALWQPIKTNLFVTAEIIKENQNVV